MSYPYTPQQIQELVKTAKVLRRPEILLPGEPIPFAKFGDRGKRIDLPLDLVDGPPLVDLRFHVRAPVFDDRDTFEAALILASARVRGVGWNPTGKKRFYGREVIPKGWHQNVIDPNAAAGHAAGNRHQPLDNFDPTDLADFFTKAAALWHIDFDFEEHLL